MTLYYYAEPRAYRLHKFARTLHRDLSLRGRFRSSPDEVMKEFGLTQEEQDIVKSRDPVKMYNWGLNPYGVFYIVWEAYERMHSPLEAQKLDDKVKKIKNTSIKDREHFEYVKPPG